VDGRGGGAHAGRLLDPTATGAAVGADKVGAMTLDDEDRALVDRVLAKSGKQPVLWKDWLPMEEATTEAIVRHRARIVALETKVAELETKAAPGCRWEGVYRPEHRYSAGSLITHSGSLWLVTRTTDERPGTTDAYTLVVKRGRVADE